MLKLFGITKIPLIFFCRPRIVNIDNNSIELKISLNRRTKNHLGSFYFGAFCIGADLTAGFFAMHLITQSKQNVQLIFKDFKANFLKRAEGDVHFYCNMGMDISNLVSKAISSDTRVNLPVLVNAKVPELSDEIVAEFELTLSLKKKKK